MFKVRKTFLVVLVLLLILSFNMCIGGLAAEKTDNFIIGISNPWVGSEWRTQMVDDVLEAVKVYKEEGLIKEVIVQSFDVTLEGQIDQIRNLITKGADVILVNPADAKALNPIIREAKKKGIIVIATDTEVSSTDAINVAIDQSEFARISSKWLAEKLNGSGKIVTINGIAGHPANTARIKGYKEIFEQYSGINILNETNGDWDQAKGQVVMQNLLATYRDLDGVWVQDGMAEGALLALLAAERTDVKIIGEARVGYLKLWKEKGIDTIGVANPPGCMTSALQVAVQMLRGKELKDNVLEGPYGNTIYVPIPAVVTNENFDEVFSEYKDYPDYYSVDGSITAEEAARYFK